MIGEDSFNQILKSSFIQCTIIIYYCSQKCIDKKRSSLPPDTYIMYLSFGFEKTHKNCLYVPVGTSCKIPVIIWGKNQQNLYHHSRFLLRVHVYTFTKVGARACFLSHGQVKIGYISKTVPTCVGEKLPDQQIIGKQCHCNVDIKFGKHCFSMTIINKKYFVIYQYLKY